MANVGIAFGMAKRVTRLNQGTGFYLGKREAFVPGTFVEREDKGCLLVTARHVVAGKTMPPGHTLVGSDEITDIAIFNAPGIELESESAPYIDRGGEEISIGERVYWQGFPFGLNGGQIDGIEVGIVGSGTIGGLLHVPVPSASGIASQGYIIDGMSNPGYSGSPVFIRRPEPNGRGYRPHVISVVSGTMASGTNHGLMAIGRLDIALNNIAETLPSK